MQRTIGQEFNRKTRLSELGELDRNLGVPQPPLELPVPPGAVLIALPPAGDIQFPQADLRSLIEQRRSRRNYSEEPLTLEELSALLWLTQGVKRITARPTTLRTVPSAGARHAFETILLVNRVEGLQPGLYRYCAIEHGLLPLEAPLEISEQLTHACHDQAHVRSSAVAFFWVAVAERMTWRFQQRGYRYMYQDSGHVCQTLYLLGEALGCGVCAVGEFDDDLVNATLGVDGEEQFLIYAATIGRVRAE